MKNKVKKERKSIKKKPFNLRGFSVKVYEALLVKPTTSYVIKATGKSKHYVGVYISNLIKRGYIQRVGYGIYKVKRSPGVVAQTEINYNKQKKRKQEQLLEKDYLRLHNLQIELNIPKDTHANIKNMVFKKKTFDNIRGAGSIQGRYFDVGNITYMITFKKLYAYFPKDWEIEGDTIEEIGERLYDQIWNEISAFENRCKLNIMKDGRFWFNIRNMHIALVRNGVIKEFNKNKIKGLVVYDDDDGKPRFIMDLSKGLHEMEAVHPEKAFNDADEAQFFMENLKDGKVREVIENFGDLDEIKKTIHLLSINLQKLIQTQQSGLINTELLIKSHTKTQKQLEATAISINAISEIVKTKKENIDKSRPSYVG